MSERCELCRFWPVQATKWGDHWSGLGGPHTNGSVSDCRRRAPIAVKDRGASYPHDSAIWPETKIYDWCGDFEKGRE